jgi:Fur family transcriptional regulator, zinc uptake regulator
VSAATIAFDSVAGQVLSLICQSHKPLGAYDLLEKLQEKQGHRIAPPTIYRALEFLLAQGFIHRISSLNAFIACFHPEQSHYAYFLICQGLVAMRLSSPVNSLC